MMQGKVLQTQNIKYMAIHTQPGNAVGTLVQHIQKKISQQLQDTLTSTLFILMFPRG